jgi:dTDP-4-dehydrorhamnose reductase
MHKTKILILGRRGQVGWELRHKLASLGQVTAVGSSELDLSSPDSIRNFVRATEPAVIVNAAAYTSVDNAESDIEPAAAINGVAPGVLAEEAKRLGSILVHYSTDYVFDGTKRGSYVESDAPNPMNVYGKTKLAGDLAIEAVGGDYLIMRTSWVYGSRGNNFLLTMSRLAQERSELRIVDDQIGAPTSSDCIAQATADMLVQVLAQEGRRLDGRSGIYNLTAKGETTWFGFAKALLTQSADTSGFAIPTLIPICTGDYPRPARRPANSRLSCQKLAETFVVTLPHWEHALSSVLETMAAKV